jgi:hypothetical protein
MYSCHFEGVHLHTLTSYRILMPASPGPGGEWVVHYSYWPHSPVSSPVREDLPESSFGARSENVEPLHETYVFATPKAREGWWNVMRKQPAIQWMELPVDTDLTRLTEDS